MNLGELLVQALPIVLEGKTTSGDANSVADTTLTGKFDDDSFKDAMLFIRVTTDGLAPEDQYSVITAYSDATGEFTVSPDFTAAVGAGDYYAIADPIWNLYTVLRLVNLAFKKMGQISLTNESLIIADNTLSYDLPEALWGYPIDRIEIGNSSEGFVNVGGYERIYPTTSSGTHAIAFTIQPREGTVRIWYRGYHDILDSFGDPISPTIPDPLAIEYVKNELFNYLLEKEGRIGEDMMRRLNIRRGDLAQIEAKNHIQNANKQISRFLNIRDW